MVIYVWNAVNKARFALQLHPDTRIGPPPAQKENPFTNLFGQGACTRGFAKQKYNFDFQRRQWGATQRQDQTPHWTTSLKGMIEDVAGIEIARQKLVFRGMPMTIDELTVGSYGVVPGETVCLSVRREHGRCQDRDLALATTAKKREQLVHRARQAALAGAFDENRKQIERKLVGGRPVMPKWIHQGEDLCAFAHVGSGLNGEGDKVLKVAGQWPETNIFYADVNDSAMSRIRSLPLFVD